MGIGKYSHITPALYDLCWLAVCLCIHFKVLLLTFKVIHGLASSYLSDIVNIRQKSSYHLRSNMIALHSDLSITISIKLCTEMHGQQLISHSNVEVSIS